MTTQNEAPLPEMFISRNQGEFWHLHCKICHTGFRLKKTSDHPGNLLALLDHHAECEQKHGKLPTN